MNSLPSSGGPRPCPDARFDGVRSVLADAVASTQDNNRTMCQLDTQIVVHHSPLDDGGERIRARTSLHFQVMNPFLEPLRLPPFRTTFNHGGDEIRGELFRMLEYTVRSEDGSATLLTVAPGSVSREVDPSTGEITYVADTTYEVAPCSIVRVAFISERNIQFNDTYKYIVRLRPVYGLTLRYESNDLQAAVGMHGVQLRPQLTLISNTADLKRTEGHAPKGVRSWQLDGWLLQGNGVVLSW